LKAIVFPREQIVSQLHAAFDRIKSDVIVFHTDLMRIGIINQVKPRDQLLSDYWSVIQEVVGDRCLLFPTFNYGFCRDGVYNVETSPAEVGVLNEYIRQLDPNQRTRTPVFNFCICNNNDLSLSALENPFSVESTFGELVEAKARIVFFGARFSGNTFIHHVEEIMNIGYRYIKPFAGVIIEPDGTSQKITLQYRVRPLDGGLTYDWEALEVDLDAKGLLGKQPLGQGFLMHYRADLLLEYWSAKIQEDELYLLTPDARSHTKSLYKTYGYPLTFSTIEGLD
jgi:aminoglycoside 3-N-acetyltransferase